VQATNVRTFELLGIITALTAGLALCVLPNVAPASAPAMPSPSPEPLGIRLRETRSIACDADGVSTVVFRGRVQALDPDRFATFHFSFAEMPSRYMVMTGAKGAFEVRVPRAELGIVDLCALPSSDVRPARFEDDQMSIEYELTFER
jgi:hypothetical protein